MKNKELKEKLESLEKTNKRYKIIIIGFIIVFLIEVLVFFNGIYLYTHKDIIRRSKTVDLLNSYRSKINTKYTPELNSFENIHNASHKLKLVSSYGDNQAYHPKVLAFKDKWNGYKYWITFSPFPYGNEKYENPHIMASNDLINWEEPAGFKNPVEDTPSNYKAKAVYNSDPHIVYNNDTNKLELYWRYVNDVDDLVIIYRKTTTDGVNWSEKEEILKANRSKKDYISPAIIYEKGQYKMWYVDKKNVLKYIESNDGYNYKNEQIIKLKYPLAVLKTWHLDVIKTEKGYEMITVAYVNFKDRNSMNLYYFNSKNNKDWSNGIVILRPSLVSWDNSGIYRSSFIYEDGVYYVFYSGVSSYKERGIAMSYGEHIENLIGSNIEY